MWALLERLQGAMPNWRCPGSFRRLPRMPEPLTSIGPRRFWIGFAMLAVTKSEQTRSRKMNSSGAEATQL
jgi:hypothetical protein